VALSRDDLINAIEFSIGALAPAYRGAAAESDLYEASLLAIATEAADAAGGDCLITNDGVTKASPLIFRRSPGNLYLGNFTYVKATFPRDRILEIHLGVYVAGGSRVPHECDVAILDHVEAERSRLGLVHPRSTKLVASIEAKHYQSSPGLGIGRSFIGLASEMGGAKCTLAFPARGSSTIRAVLAKRTSECYDELIPETAAAERLRGHLTQKMKNWIAAR
jgi:hypothetical protein